MYPSEHIDASFDDVAPKVVPDVRDRLKQLLQEQFPNDQATCRHLLENDLGFRDLCEEYEACLDAIQRLGHSYVDRELRMEYVELRLEIEEELLHHIADYEFGRKGR